MTVRSGFNITHLVSLHNWLTKSIAQTQNSFPLNLTIFVPANLFTFSYLTIYAITSFICARVILTTEAVCLFEVSMILYSFHNCLLQKAFVNVRILWVNLSHPIISIKWLVPAADITPTNRWLNVLMNMAHNTGNSGFWTITLIAF